MDRIIIPSTRERVGELGGHICRHKEPSVDIDKMSIELILGGMFSGKTRELIRRIDRARIADQEVALYKYTNDTRYSVKLAASHDGITMEATPIVDARTINYKAGMVIGIDEGQFIENIAEMAETMANAGVKVIIAGLNSDFQRNSFPRLAPLYSKAEQLDIFHAICQKCKKKDASFTKRLVTSVHDQQQELIGGKESYQAVCRKCYFQ